jgi:hypothetical protein
MHRRFASRYHRRPNAELACQPTTHCHHGDSATPDHVARGGQFKFLTQHLAKSGGANLTYQQVNRVLAKAAKADA